MSRNPRVEIRVLASPTREFALMLSVLNLSLKKFCGLEDFSLTVFVGNPPEDAIHAAVFAEWLSPDIDCIMVDTDLFQEHGIHGSAMQRIEAPTDADIVICMDADMVSCGDLAGIVSEVMDQNLIAGVIAHGQPLSHIQWARLHTQLGLVEPDFRYRSTGWPYMWPLAKRHRGAERAPAYFNYGFVVIPARILKSIAEHYRDLSNELEKMAPKNMFRSQVALTLAIAKAGVPHRELGMRYNFPNDTNLEALHSDELKDARMIHLLRRNQFFDKQLAYESIENLREFADSGWVTAGALERARSVIEGLIPEITAQAPPDNLAPARWIW